MGQIQVRVAVLLCVVGSLAAPSSALADTLIATSPCPPSGPGPGAIAGVNGCTAVSAHAGRLVWSAFDPATGRYALMTASAGGVSAVAVAQRARAFDADLGEDAAGRVVAVYSRCAADPDGPPTGCEVREVAFTAGAREHPLLPGVRDGDPLLPSRWRERVAVARRTAGGAREARLCSAAGEPRCRSLPGGPTGATPRDAGPRSIDIDARRIVIGWFWDANGTVRRHAILVSSFSASTATEVARAGAGYAGNAAVHSAVLDGDYVYYARGGASCDYGSPPNAVGRYDLARRTVEEVHSPALAGVAVDAGRIIYAACTPLPPVGVAGATRIVAADPPPFGRPGALSLARAARCPAARTSGWTAQTIGRPGRSPQGIGLAADATDAAIAVWPGRRALTYATRAPGHRFGRERTVPGGAGPFDPRFASDDRGHAVIGWVRSSDAGAVVAATTASVRGPVRRPQALAGDSSSPDAFGVPAVAIAPDGGAVAAWAGHATPGAVPGTVFVAFRAAGAASFGAPLPIATGVTRTRLLTIAAGSGGRALVVLSGYFEPQVDVVEMTAAGEAGRRTLTGTGGPPTLGAAALGGGGAAAVAWTNGASTQIAGRPAGASGFAPVTRISTPDQPVGALSLDARGGQVAVAWSERDVRSAVARMKVARGRLGGSLGVGRVFAAVRGRIGEARIALGPDAAAALVWQLSCGTSGRVLVATAPVGSGGNFGSPVVVSGSDLHVQAPAVAIGRGGRPIVGWVAGSRPIGDSRVRIATARR